MASGPLVRLAGPLYDPKMALVVVDQPDFSNQTRLVGLRAANQHAVDQHAVDQHAVDQPAVNKHVVNAHLALSRRSILSLYWLVPVVVAIVLGDVAAGSPLQRWLPRSPESWVFFTLFFGTPHIVASSLMLFGIADYRRHYRKQILRWSAAIAIALALLNELVSYDVLYALIAAWTVKHVLGQQFGIGNSVARCSGSMHKAWQWLGLGTGTVAFVTLHRGHHWRPELVSRAHVVVWCGVAMIVCVGAWLTVRCSTRDGRVWVAANSAMVCVSVVMLLCGYPFFTVLIPRIIHDATAFKVYSVHERNRARSRGRSSGWMLVCGMGATLLVSALLERILDRPLSQLMALVGVHTTTPVALYVAGFLGLVHYCSEAVTWRTDSPYRRHFAMTA
jgi:hypothetical protein